MGFNVQIWRIDVSTARVFQLKAADVYLYLCIKHRQNTRRREMEGPQLGQTR